MMQNSSLRDDEELARMLQYQEQTTAHSASNLPLDEQEQRDSEIARQFAEMEMASDHPRTDGSRRMQNTLASSYQGHYNRQPRAHSLDRQDSASRFSHPAPTATPLPTASAQISRRASLRSSSTSPGHNRSLSDDNFNQISVGNYNSNRDREYAQQLQESYRGRTSSSRPGVSEVVHTPEERADMELARRMQEMENNRHSGAVGDSASPSNLNLMDEDERIARLMEATGKSLRDLDFDPVVDLKPPPPESAPGPHLPAGVAVGRPEPSPLSASADVAAPSTPFVHAEFLPHGDEQNVSPLADGTEGRLPRDPSGVARLLESPLADVEIQDADCTFLDVPVPKVDPRKTKSRSFLGGFRNRNSKPPLHSASDPVMATPVPLSPDRRKPLPPGSRPPNSPASRIGVPAAIPPPPGEPLSAGIPTAIPPPPGGSLTVGRPSAHRGPRPTPSSSSSSSSVCFTCGKSNGSFVVALGRKYHPECFRCLVCGELIDVKKPFAFSKDEQGLKHPHHPRCFSQQYASTCCICRHKLPANDDGTISFVKHPFFDTEEMCPKHALEGRRRCTGCHRFEPDFERFVDLDDSNRCVCFSCCRSVVTDNNDASFLWNKVIHFFRNTLKLPVWEGMSDIPIMLVGYEILNEQLQLANKLHTGAAQITTRGLCLTDHSNCGRFFRVPSMRFNSTDSSFEAANGNDKFTFSEVPQDILQPNSNSKVYAILCLSGLPGDLTASVLAHEAAHAWIKMHPEFDVHRKIAPQVEEGVAQLIALLLLQEGLGTPAASVAGETGPSDAKLRQYFCFSIESAEDEIYGTGYRRAAAAYQALGMEALLMHVVRYGRFPHT